jgi:DNA-directed RNA polymerase specialized sigma24 family protein
MNEATDPAADRHGQTMPSDSFSALMLRLKREGSSALGYETLRQRLIRFFRLHFPAHADELADRCLDRLGRKLLEGTAVLSLNAYTLAIARMVLHEWRAQVSRGRAHADDPTALPDPTDPARPDDTDDTDDDTLMAALSRCLEKAGVENRALILAYYSAEGAARIAMRKRLAEQHGSSLNALRNRALRLRSMLEDCIRKCLRERSAS